MNDGLCQCGCGQPAPIAKRTVTSRGRIKGQPLRYIRGHNSRGMDRSKPYKSSRYVEEDRGFKTPCWIWQLKVDQKTGYGVTRTGGHDQLAHRFFYEQAHGPIDKGMQIDHLCSVRSCVNPAHLEPVTPLENSRRGRSAKLTIQQAREIHRLTQSGVLTQAAIGQAFGVSRQTVALIARNGPDGPRNPGQRGRGSR